MGTTGGIIIGIILLSILMFIHELGHYLTGRMLGFKIIEFSLFMGPVLLSKTSKKTGIKYSLKLLPIGASVRFDGEVGMGEEDSDDSDSFNKQAKWKRAIVIGTGPVINIIAGILAFLILFGSTGFISTTVDSTSKDSQAAAAGLLNGDRVVTVNGAGIWTSIDYSMELNFLKEDKSMTVAVARPGMAENIIFELKPEKKSVYRLGITTQVDKAGSNWKVAQIDPESNGGKPVLKPGDSIISINGVNTSDYELASKEISGSEGKPISIQLIRDNKEMTVESTPGLKDYYTDRGIVFAKKAGVQAAFGESLRYSASIVKLTFKSISMIFTGKVAAKDSLSGPVGVVDMVSTMVNQTSPIQDKIENLLWLFGMISLNLGIFNLLPIPALDGSHLLLIAVEAIRRKRLSAKVEQVIVMTGFLLIIGLAVMGLIFDIMRISGRS